MAPIFEYRALNEKGKELKGIIDADNSAAARGKLRSQGLHPTTVTRTAEKQRSISRLRFKRARAQDIAVSMRQFSTLLGSGLSLVESLTALMEQTDHPQLKKTFSRMREVVLEGKPLSAAMSEHSGVFNELQINMIRAGEGTGGLEVVLERLAELLEKRLELIQRVRSALTYPIFMLIIGFGVLMFLMTFVVPRVTGIFEEAGQSLPAPTIALMAVAGVMQKIWWLILLIGIGLAYLGVRFVRTKKGREVKDRLLLRLPIFGSLEVKLVVARFTRTLGTLLQSGVTLLPSLDICRAVANNAVFERAIENIRDEVEAGKTLAGPLRKAGVFPPMAAHMAQSGEKSGKLEEMMLRIADTYEREVANSVNAMTSLLEPIMILIMGVAVGFIVLAVLLPILDMSQAIH